jgi:hypothetical protein
MISFGTDFVAGRNLVPSPATGKMAFVTFFRITQSSDQTRIRQRGVAIQYHSLGQEITSKGKN